MNNLENILFDIQDKLVPILDSYEQAVYHYIFRHTYLVGEISMCFSTASAEIGYGSGVKNGPPSKKTRSDRIRSLERKGCLKVLERSNLGITVEIILPSNISCLKSPNEGQAEIDINALDFYKDRRLLSSILAREDFKCFYTGKKISLENCYLDHVIPQVSGGDNSYKNIVASSYDANTIKSAASVHNFIRDLYREDIISLIELKSLKKKIEQLQDGQLMPDIELIKSEIRR